MEWRDLPKAHCPRGGEVETLQFALDRVRQQFAWKTGGLTAEQLRRRHPPSTMTLAGLVKHMAFVEDGFTARAADRPLPPPWDTRTWSENGEWGWASAVTDEPEELYELWYAAASRSRSAWEQLSADGGLDALVEDPDPAWTSNRRRVLIDLLEEYLKHTGHADVLREAVDGVRGNDPD
ncbi:mycothiol transferase [Kribbella sp. NPDC054772]